MQISWGTFVNICDLNNITLFGPKIKYRLEKDGKMSYIIFDCILFRKPAAVRERRAGAGWGVGCHSAFPSMRKPFPDVVPFFLQPRRLFVNE